MALQICAYLTVHLTSLTALLETSDIVVNARSDLEEVVNKPTCIILSV
jgi:hypothetical protein